MRVQGCGPSSVIAAISVSHRLDLSSVSLYMKHVILRISFFDIFDAFIKYLMFKTKDYRKVSFFKKKHIKQTMQRELQH